MADEVIILKRFRDRYLLSNDFGRTLVRFYNKHSLKSAEYIRCKEPLKVGIKLCLRLPVYFSYQRWCF